MLNEREQKLITKLRGNSRANIREVAKELNLPTSTTYDILHRLEQKKVIAYSSRVAFERVGYPIQMIVIVKTSIEYKDKLKAYLIKQKNVNTLHTINNKSNFHVECIFRNQREVEEFLEGLEQENTLTQINVYNIIETIQIEKFLTEKEHFDY